MQFRDDDQISSQRTLLENKELFCQLCFSRRQRQRVICGVSRCQSLWDSADLNGLGFSSLFLQTAVIRANAFHVSAWTGGFTSSYDMTAFIYKTQIKPPSFCWGRTYDKFTEQNSSSLRLRCFLQIQNANVLDEFARTYYTTKTKQKNRRNFA